MLSAAVIALAAEGGQTSVMSKVSFSILYPKRACHELTCDTGSIAEIEGIPDHGPVGNWEQSLGVLIWIGGKCWK